MASGLITSWQIDGETMETMRDFILGSSKITADGNRSHEIKTCLLLGRTSYDQARQHIKKQRHYFANKGPSSQDYGFSSSHVWMWELDYKESAKKLMLLNCIVGEDSRESPGLQGDQTSQSSRKSTLSIHWKDWCWSWNSNILPPHVKNWVTGEDPDAGKH